MSVGSSLNKFKCDFNDLLFCAILFHGLVLLQVEDAMLMFDKQTNRHRGKFFSSYSSSSFFLN